ncbi:hypothetical protein D3C81_1764990 [compost metagenome]
MIGVQHRVVVAVGDLLAAAPAQIGGIAGRGEVAEARRVALEIARPVVAQLVQHHHPVTRSGAHLRGQVVDQDLVHAAPVGAQLRVLGVIQRLHRQAFAYALAAGLVVAPQRADPRAVQYVQQRLVRADVLRVIVVATIG